MGKRELLLILAFAVAGTVVYQLTAAERPGRSTWSSITSLWRHAIAEIKGRNVSVTVRRTAETAVDDRVERLSLTGFRGQVTVVGEARDNVAAELVTEAWGIDQADADEESKGVHLALRPDGDTLVVDVTRPPNGARSQARLQLAVPARLSATLELSGRLDVKGVGGVRLATRAGAVALREIAGDVRGEHRDGDLEIAGAHSVALTVRRSDVRIAQVRGDLSGEYIDGRLKASNLGGSVRLELRRTHLELDRPSRPVRVAAADGSVTIQEPAAEVAFEGRRSPFTLIAGRAAPLEATSADARVELVVRAASGVSLDLAAENGRLALPEAGPTVERLEQREQARGPLGGGGVTWRVRSTRGDIVVRQ